MSTEIEEKLDYSKTPMASHSVLGMRKVSPLSIPQPLTISASGGDAFEFILSPGVIQPNKCRLNFKLNLTETNAKYNFLHVSALSVFRQVTAQLENGFQLCDLQEADKQYELVWAAETSQNDLLASQDYIATTTNAAYMDFLHQSNNSTVLVPDSNTAITAAGGKAYIGRDYVVQVGAVGDGAGAGNASLYISVPFDKLFCNTVLAEKRLLYIPKNLVIRLTLNPLAKLGFCAGGAATPATGTAALAGASMEEVQMIVAYEKSPEIISNMMAAVSSGAMTFLTPFQRILYNAPLAGTSQGTALRINSAMGDLKLRRTYLALFNNTTTGATAYDHSCVNPYSVSLGTDRVKSVTAETLDNSPQIDFQPRITANYAEDWEVFAPVLKGSVAGVDLAGYRYRWVLPRLWDEEQSIVRDYTKSKGVPLTPNEIQYSYQLETVSATNLHFVVGVFERKLAISREGMAWVFS